MTGPRAILAVLLCVLPALAPAKAYKGAELRTKASYTYGRFEVRMKSFQRSGALSSFFTYNDSYPSTPWNELDIEILGRYEHDVQFNAITAGTTNHVAHHYTPFNPALDFHVYAIEWTPAYVAWFIDGVEALRQTGAHIPTITQAQKIMMNVWNPTAPNWAGAFDSTSLPAFAMYDWVSYASYTPGSGTTGTGGNFTPQWRDDFNAFDGNRWEKATHTWDGNGCDFVQENVVYQNGLMVLCLTDAAHLGYQDAQKPTLRYAWVHGANATVRFSEELDSTTAVNPANYLVAGGATISSISLWPDGRTIECALGNQDTSHLYNFVVLNAKDRFGNTSGIMSKLLRHVNLTTFPVKINVGGPGWSGYLADMEWNDDADYGYMDGIQASAPGAPISGTTEQEVFRTERYLLAQYRVRIPDGTYRVKALMSENYFTSAGQRQFSITAEDRALATDLDLYAVAGKNAAVVRTIEDLSVTDGTLDLYFSGKLDNPLIDGIVIERPATGIGEASGTVPDRFVVSSNFPNPFNSTTMFRVTLPGRSPLTLRVFDTLGRTVAVKDLGEFGSGVHAVAWNASAGTSLSSGLYLFSVEGAFGRQTGKMIYLK
jgi:beta-glucanase (GH16 family)